MRTNVLDSTLESRRLDGKSLRLQSGGPSPGILLCPGSGNLESKLGRIQGVAGVRLAGMGAKGRLAEAGTGVQLETKAKDLGLPPCSSLLSPLVDLDNPQETLLTPPALP